MNYFSYYLLFSEASQIYIKVIGTPANFWPVVAADVMMENSNHDFWPFRFRYLLENHTNENLMLLAIQQN